MRAWICLTAVALAACTGPYEPAPLTAKQTTKLDKALAGLTPGKPVACISQFPSKALTVISNDVVLYKVSSRLTYRNDLIGGCSGLTSGDALVTVSSNTQLCRGDIARTANLMVGFQTGSCALGDFVPYRKPG